MFYSALCFSNLQLDIWLLKILFRHTEKTLDLSYSLKTWIFPSFLLILVLLCFRLPLSDDPDLAMAFSVARRAAAVPLLLVNGTYRKTIRTYLDSSILQYQLQRLNKHGSLKGLLLICSFFLECHLYVPGNKRNWSRPLELKKNKK